MKLQSIDLHILPEMGSRRYVDHFNCFSCLFVLWRRLEKQEKTGKEERWDTQT